MRRLVVLATAAAALAGIAAGPAPDEGHERDLRALLGDLDDNYPFFEAKDIEREWRKLKGDLLRRARRCKSDEEFVEVLADALRGLRDGHAGFAELKVEVSPAPLFYPGISFLPATEGRVVVMTPPAGLESKLPCGTVVTKIDGKDARKVLDERGAASWKAGGFFSSPQRARFFEYRLPLTTRESGERYEIHYRDDRRERKVTLAATREVRGWPHEYNLPKDLAQGSRSAYHAQLASGAGYLYLRRIDADVHTGVAAAIAAHPAARGWIVDLRGNTGGGYDKELLEQMGRLARPVAVLIDAGCISAGETVARDLVRIADARLFGSTSAGSSTSKKVFQLPSGLAQIRYSVRSRPGPDGRPIEFHGIAPHVEVEAVPEELLRGDNSAILRAEEHLAAAAK